MASNPTLAPRDEPAKDAAAVSAGGAAAKSVRRRRAISIGLAILGLTVLSYVVGAAVMFFRLPTSTFLANAFVGALAWNERREVLANFSSHDSAPVTRGLIDKPGKTYDGFTLVATLGLDAPSTEVVLLNMNRQVVHRWFIPFSRV
jgi:hypothetical protein